MDNKVQDPDPVIGRFLAALSPEEIGNIRGVTRNEYGMIVAWVWLPDSVFMQWEGEPVFNVQFGKYAFSDHDVESDNETIKPVGTSSETNSPPSIIVGREPARTTLVAPARTIL